MLLSSNLNHADAMHCDGISGQFLFRIPEMFSNIHSLKLNKRKIILDGCYDTVGIIIVGPYVLQQFQFGRLKNFSLPSTMTINWGRTTKL